MKVLAEFVDGRNGKRYFRGDGDKINPPLDPEQIERLKKAGCVGEGSETKTSSGSSKPKSPAKGSDTSDGVLDKDSLKKLTVEQLKTVAETLKIDLGDAKKEDDIVAAIQLHAEAAEAEVKGNIVAAVQRLLQTK